MTEEFDPYSHWLGIGAEQRPVDHYRLLGVARFCGDPATIAVAADRQMALIRSYQTGPRGRYTQALLNEMAAAKLCLLNPAAKASYDAMLEGLAAATSPSLASPPLAVPPPPPPPAPPDAASSSPVVANVLADDGLEDPEADPFAAGSHSRGPLVVMLALVVIVAMGATVGWQVIAARQRDPAIGPLVATGYEDLQNHGADDVGETVPAEPVVVFQETDGSVNFTPSVAVLQGAELRLETVDITDRLVGWTAGDVASWKFKIVKLPPNGVFRVLITYRATSEADEGDFMVAIDGREKTCRIRGTGEYVTDEYFLAVTRPGDQMLQLHSPRLLGGAIEFKGIRLVMPQGRDEDS